MAVAHTAVPASITESQTALVKQDRATCHNDRNKNNAGGLTLANFDAAKVGHDAEVAEVAEKMIRKLRAGMMPPPQARRPDGTALGGFCRVDGNRGSMQPPRSIRIPATVRSSA